MWSSFLSLSIFPASPHQQPLGRRCCPGGELAQPPGERAMSAQSREGLIALYDATGGNLWTNKANWRSSSSVCNWYGITCDGSGAVSTVVLNGNNMAGSLPTEVGLLTEVRYALDLYSNTIGGYLPTQIGQLTQLNSLDVQGNILSGTMPTEAGQSTSLSTFLHVQGNPKLSGTLPTEFAALTKLKAFHWTQSKLSGTLPTAIGAMTALTAIGLNGNSLSGTLPTEVGLLTNLQSSLKLSDNQLTGPIPTYFGKLSKLHTLTLDRKIVDRIPFL